MAHVERSTHGRWRGIDGKDIGTGPRGVESIDPPVFPADHPFLFEPFQRRLFRKPQVRGIDACQRCWHPVIVLGSVRSGQEAASRYLIDPLIRSISSRTSRSAVDDTRSMTVSRKAWFDIRSSTRAAIRSTSSSLICASGENVAKVEANGIAA